MGLFMPNSGVKMAHLLMMSFSVRPQLLLRSRPKNRFEAALRFFEEAHGTVTETYLVVWILNLLYTLCVHLLAEESYVMYHETVIIFQKFAFMHSVEKIFGLLFSLPTVSLNFLDIVLFIVFNS